MELALIVALSITSLAFLTGTIVLLALYQRAKQGLENAVRINRSLAKEVEEAEDRKSSALHRLYEKNRTVDQTRERLDKSKAKVKELESILTYFDAEAVSAAKEAVSAAKEAVRNAKEMQAVAQEQEAASAEMARLQKTTREKRATTARSGRRPEAPAGKHKSGAESYRGYETIDSTAVIASVAASSWTPSFSSDSSSCDGGGSSGGCD